MLGELNTELKESPPLGVFDSDVYLLKEESALKRVSLADPPEACRLLILLRDPAHETCAPADLELLNKIADWKDLKLKRSGVTVVNLARRETSLLELNKNVHASNIIGFGITPADIGFHIEHTPNALFTFRKVNFIFTSSLKELTADEKMKSKFFREALRPMFQ